MSDNDTGGSEHGIRVESTQIYQGYVSPSNASLLTGEGDGFDRLLERPTDNESFDLEFHAEKKITFECECGKKFRKGRTAREHLERYQEADT